MDEVILTRIRQEAYEQGYQDGKLDGYNLEGEWIPVAERLPEAGIEVWVTIRGHDVIVPEAGETFQSAVDRIMNTRWVTRGYWSEEEQGWNNPDFGAPLAVQPVAWMKIDRPEPWDGE